MNVTHYDLFAGIGGFSYALDAIFDEHHIEHVFCEWEPFPTAVLKKHWPHATYYGDIADLIADTASKGRSRGGAQDERRRGLSGREIPDQEQEMVIVTGGFPCQPFSVAGRRQGTADDRYKWPEMLAVIQNVRPNWVIAENVRGLATWNDGMVLETVCTDLEGEGYEVQPLVIPACAVGAPHRRDRVWIIAHAIDGGQRAAEREGATAPDSVSSEHRSQDRPARQSKRADRNRTAPRPTTDAPEAEVDGVSGREELSNAVWNRDWREVAFATCHDRVDDGLPRWMDGVAISAARHRTERLKACGNAIVPQAAMAIFRTIAPCAGAPLSHDERTAR